MAPDYRDHDLDLELVFDRFLGEDDLEALRQRLVDRLPEWTRELRVWRSRETDVSIDVQAGGALGSIVLSQATGKGPLYRELMQRSGSSTTDRRFGSVELRGANPAVTMVVSIDDQVASHIGPRLRLGNRVVLQVRRPTVEQRPNVPWARTTFEDLCASLAPARASARHPGEYWAKVMSERPSIQAVGRDFARHLPGLFWLNDFGRPYVELIGEQTLLGAPATQVLPLTTGVVVVRGADPREWASPALLETERDIIDHLGADLFYDQAFPDRSGRAPQWGARG